MVNALRGIDLEVAEGEFFVLLGPSGCGKTTTLRCVAGLERPDGGEIEINQKIVNSPSRGVYIPAEKRDIGMVFQSYAIWPHMTVFKNVAFPLTQGQKRFSRDAVQQKVRQALKRVQLDGLEERPATDLSGGQQQRVAMARAMVTEPQILLMDEPLSNLDARLREQMRTELKKITSSIRVTILYVTHDQAEALSLGDRVCVMHEGQILQIGSPQEIYASPPNLFVAQFVGDMNFIDARVSGPSEIQTPFGTLPLAPPATCSVGSQVVLAMRPEHVTLLDHDEESTATAEGKITNRTYIGNSALFEVEACGVTLTASAPGDTNFQVGQHAKILLPEKRWHVYPKTEVNPLPG